MWVCSAGESGRPSLLSGCCIHGSVLSLRLSPGPFLFSLAALWWSMSPLFNSLWKQHKRMQPLSVSVFLNRLLLTWDDTSWRFSCQPVSAAPAPVELNTGLGLLQMDSATRLFCHAFVCTQIVWETKKLCAGTKSGAKQELKKTTHTQLSVYRVLYYQIQGRHVLQVKYYSGI